MARPRDDLKSEIAKGNVLAIVGAGVSMGATHGNPLASWTGLLTSGVERCVERCKLPPGWEERRRGEIASGDLDELLSAAENVATKLGAPSGGEYRTWLRETVGSLRTLEGAVLAALRELGIRSYEQILGNAHTQALQQALRTTRALLFVGCGAGLDDPNFRALRQWSKVFKESEYGHFRGPTV